MASPLSDRIEPKPSGPIHQIVLSQFQGDWVERLSVEQMFILIDGVLPFEACLYYQVLPLFLEGSRLNLGMVSPEDTSALDYVRRITSYLHYSLVPRPMSSGALQAVLSAYLHHSGSSPNRVSKPASAAPDRPPRGSTRAKPGQHIDRSLQPTLVVDSPEDLNLERLEDVTLHTTPVPPPAIETVPPIAFMPPTSLSPADVQEEEITLPPLEAVETAPLPESAIEAPQLAGQPPTIPPPLMMPLPVLQVQANYLSNSVEVLAGLPPQDLLQELLGRVLLGGIGRLYFERQPQYGRVLWSQNGVLQSVLDRLDLGQFQGVLNELKRVVGLPLIPVQKPRQAEVERLYQNTRLLLRLRVMPTAQGEEEATLQVLRGAALKFYQQQQLAGLERDALTIAKQLQLKVNEIRDRTRSDPSLSRARLDALPGLAQMLRYIEAQLEDLQTDP